VKKEKPTSGPGSRQPTLKLPTLMPDGTKVRVHPLLYLLKTSMGGQSKSDLARVIGVKPQSLYKWETRCKADRNFPLPVTRAILIAGFFGVDPHLFRPDVFKVPA